ncbi:ATP-binding cassette domain-containing protein [Microbulbifer sp. CAU 1566]|uniref:ABC-F family ATP-binding cassette domain-containing protein n=1 Tax=Microbulbifer sp. CAU 1566 TaxID=2933269 RepID=UPI0020060B6F|nr:ATP-binding cassette domain-containing protein [Microbulbifer sp. CAU 1566]MCK7597928.1 ATP-binding cassette domain-containing protein [Microbulbifer sp. CAU 1566]
MINLQGVSLQVGGRDLLNNTSCRIFPGHKVGVIGANGCGKSTLFKLLLKQQDSDAGSVEVPSNWEVAHMAQEVDASDQSALDYALDGDHRLRELQRALAAAEADGSDGKRIGELHEQMAAIDGYSGPARAAQLLDGLGFSHADQQRPVKSFSGGWRIRLNLARALMCPADLLLLDEPTNHLDLDATLWLEQWLQRFPGTLLIISHDRDFLDAVVGGIISFEQQELVLYSGNYTAFERARAERLAQQQVQYEKQQAERAHMEDFVRRFRAKATKAKQAQSRLKALDRMAEIAPAHVDSPFRFRLPSSDKVSNPLIDLREAKIGYPGKVILPRVELGIQPGRRIGLLGPNGAGKSSLIKSLAGELPLLAGERQCGEHLKIGYFAQHQLEALDSNASPMLHVQRLSPDASEQQLRDFLGGYGFVGDRVFETVGGFSGGEKARVALALLAWQKPNLLLLDEPTNHLDLEMRHALTLALAEFPGAVVLVSHDRHLLANTTDEFILVAEGRAEPYDGDLEDYKQWLLSFKRDEKRNEKQRDETGSQPLDGKPGEDKKAQRRAAAALREQLKPLTNKLKSIEQKMAKAEKQVAQLESQLADESLYSGGQQEEISRLTQAQGQAREELETLEMEWLEISEALEAARGE